MEIGLILVAAGYGSLRTDSSGGRISKVLEEVGGMPLFLHPLKKASHAGIKKAVVVVNPLFAEAIQRAVKAHSIDMEIAYAVQPDRFGSADAVLRAIPLMRAWRIEHALIAYADMPLWSASTMRALMCVHALRATVTMAIVKRGSLKELNRYGRVLRTDSGRICRIVEVACATDKERSLNEVNPSLWIWSLPWLVHNIPRIESAEMATTGAREQHMPPLIELAYREGDLIQEVELRSSSNFEAVGVNSLSELETVRRLSACSKK